MSFLARCPSCGEIFRRERRGICQSCFEAEARRFEEVKRYLIGNQHATLEEVSRETGVKAPEILSYIRDGRLSTVEFTNISYGCEDCDTPIASGRFCKACQDRLSNKFSATVEELKAKRDAQALKRR